MTLNTKFGLVPSLLVAALAMSACSVLPASGLASKQTDTIRHLTILYTNDEHGWVEGYQNTGGAAGMAQRWRQREGLTEEGPFLVLSGGDMWTGPALSTLWEGESMAEVMNNMGYDAAAIGNHDFDFGVEALQERAEQAEFPLLAANIRQKETGEIPHFAEPYLVIEVNGIKVGIIGLTTTETKVDTNPVHVANLSFLPYRNVIPTFAAEAKQDGAELLMIVGHICARETRKLAPIAAEHDIRIIGGGHCHEEVNEQVDGVQLVESGFFMRGYVRIELLFDTVRDEIVEMETVQVQNKAGREDPEITQLLESWRRRTDPELWDTIGYTDESVDRKSPEMASLLLEPWLAAWPSADAALASPRYVQQDLYPGEISRATIVNLLSTTNELVEVLLTGAELIETIESRRPLVAGIVKNGGQYLIGGKTVAEGETYRVLMPESLYFGGHYYQVNRYDSEPSYTGIDWRGPPIDWIVAQGSTRADPISLREPDS